ncbi:MAG: UDP-glucose 4-epimerase GalE [Rhizobiaceae bacterium]|nr:UDP-glucose 4-epimerase GalE [Rhizobiaceae bacterium]
MKILVTGGAGYIGSHTFVELVREGHEPVIFDNFSNASREILPRLEQLTGKTPVMIEGDIRDTVLLSRTLSQQGAEAVIHFAGAKAVGESMKDPLKYYSNNVTGTQSLLEAMQENGVRKIVFSSSATVYGDPEQLPIPETHPLSTANTYGETKLVIENMLRAVSSSGPGWSVILLRYFNPVGAHETGLIGESPDGIPNNLMPYICQVAVGRRDKLQVYGNDYDTPDGTGVRDYIHVKDLAAGHVAAINRIEAPQCTAINLGTGRGTSVLEMVAAFSEAAGKPIPYEIMGRREGDVASCYADPGLAREYLGWEARFGIGEMCRDAWNWQSRNPMGYE